VSLLTEIGDEQERAELAKITKVLLRLDQIGAFRRIKFV